MRDSGKLNIIDFVQRNDNIFKDYVINSDEIDNKFDQKSLFQDIYITFSRSRFAYLKYLSTVYGQDVIQISNTLDLYGKG